MITAICLVLLGIQLGRLAMALIAKRPMMITAYGFELICLLVAFSYMGGN